MLLPAEPANLCSSAHVTFTSPARTTAGGHDHPSAADEHFSHRSRIVLTMDRSPSWRMLAVGFKLEPVRLPRRAVNHSGGASIPFASGRISPGRANNADRCEWLAFPRFADSTIIPPRRQCELPRQSSLASHHRQHHRESSLARVCEQSSPMCFSSLKRRIDDCDCRISWSDVALKAPLVPSAN